MAGNPAEFLELCRDYLTEARQVLAALRVAFAQRRAEELRNGAHYLKGSSQLLGAIALTQCCARLEETGRKADFSEAGALLEQASAVLQEVEQEYVRRLGTGVLPAKGSAA